MAVSWTAQERENIYSYLVQRGGMTKGAARQAVADMQADTVNLLLLPNPANWSEVWQCTVACMRKKAGQVPIVLSIADILGDVLGGLLGEAEGQ